MPALRTAEQILADRISMRPEVAAQVGVDWASGPSIMGMPIAIDPRLGANEWALIPPLRESRFNAWMEEAAMALAVPASTMGPSCTYSNARPVPSLTRSDLERLYAEMRQPVVWDRSPIELLLRAMLGRRERSPEHQEALALQREYAQWRAQRGLSPSGEHLDLLRRCEAICIEHGGSLVSQWNI